MIGGTRARITTEIARQSALSRDIAQLQEQVSTGKKGGGPSADPAGSLRLGAIRRAQGDQAAYAVNVEAAATLATRADGAMTTLSTLLDQARELVVAGRSGTYSTDDRAIMATQLRGIAADVTALSAQKDSRGSPVFPDGTPLAFPIGEDKQETATVAKAALFGGGAGAPPSIADVLAGAAAALETSDDSARTAATGDALDAIDAASSRVAAVHGELGVRAARIDAQRDALADTGQTLSDERTAIEGADVTAAIALLTSKLNTLEAGQAVFAKLNRQTLFDLLG